MVKTTKHFFQHISNHEWKSAEAIIRQINGGTITKNEAWKRGYTTALQGIMIIAKKTNHCDPQPYLLQIEKATNLDVAKMFFMNKRNID